MKKQVSFLLCYTLVFQFVLAQKYTARSMDELANTRIRIQSRKVHELDVLNWSPISPSQAQQAKAILQKRRDPKAMKAQLATSPELKALLAKEKLNDEDLISVIIEEFKIQTKGRILQLIAWKEDKNEIQSPSLTQTKKEVAGMKEAISGFTTVLSQIQSKLASKPEKIGDLIKQFQQIGLGLGGMIIFALIHAEIASLHNSSKTLSTIYYVMDRELRAAFHMLIKTQHILSKVTLSGSWPYLKPLYHQARRRWYMRTDYGRDGNELIKVLHTDGTKERIGLKAFPDNPTQSKNLQAITKTKKTAYGPYRNEAILKTNMFRSQESWTLEHEKNETGEILGHFLKHNLTGGFLGFAEADAVYAPHMSNKMILDATTSIDNFIKQSAAKSAQLRADVAHGITKNLSTIGAIAGTTLGALLAATALIVGAAASVFTAGASGVLGAIIASATIGTFVGGAVGTIAGKLGAEKGINAVQKHIMKYSSLSYVKEQKKSFERIKNNFLLYNTARTSQNIALRPNLYRVSATPFNLETAKNKQQLKNALLQIEIDPDYKISWKDLKVLVDASVSLKSNKTGKHFSIRKIGTVMRFVADANNATNPATHFRLIHSNLNGEYWFGLQSESKATLNRVLHAVSNKKNTHFPPPVFSAWGQWEISGSSLSDVVLKNRQTNSYFHEGNATEGVKLVSKRSDATRLTITPLTLVDKVAGKTVRIKHKRSGKYFYAIEENQGKYGIKKLLKADSANMKVKSKNGTVHDVNDCSKFNAIKDSTIPQNISIQLAKYLSHWQNKKELSSQEDSLKYYHQNKFWRSFNVPLWGADRAYKGEVRFVKENKKAFQRWKLSGQSLQSCHLVNTIHNMALSVNPTRYYGQAIEPGKSDETELTIEIVG